MAKIGLHRVSSTAEARKERALTVILGEKCLCVCVLLCLQVALYEIFVNVEEVEIGVFAD